MTITVSKMVSFRGDEFKMLPHITSQMAWRHDYLFSATHQFSSFSITKENYDWLIYGFTGKLDHAMQRMMPATFSATSDTMDICYKNLFQ